MKKILIKEDIDLIGDDLTLEPGDQVFIPETDSEEDMLENQRFYDDEQDATDMMYDDDNLDFEDEADTDADEGEFVESRQAKIRKYRMIEDMYDVRPKKIAHNVEKALAFLHKGIDLLLATPRGKIPVVLARTVYEVIHDQISSEYNDQKIRTFDKTMKVVALEHIDDNPSDDINATLGLA